MFEDFIDWFFEKFCITFLMILIIVSIGGLIYYGYYLITQQQYTNCTSISKRIVPSYTTFILSGKVLVPISYPTSYEVNQICEQGKRSISVDKSLYITIQLPEE